MMATLHVKSNLQCCHASPNCAAIKPERLLGEQKLLWLLPCEVALAKADPHISTLKTVAKDKSLVQGPSPRALPVTQKLDPRPRSKSFLSGSSAPCPVFSPRNATWSLQPAAKIEIRHSPEIVCSVLRTPEFQQQVRLCGPCSDGLGCNTHPRFEQTQSM